MQQQGNGNSGKDHWPVSSVLAVGPGIAGNRVIGGTNDDQRALKIDPDTLEAGESGVAMTPGMIHASLRRVAGVEDEDAIRSFGLPDQVLPLFG